MFDTLGYARKLEEVGIPREQAEAHVRIIADIVEGDLATKADLQEVKSELKADIQGLKNDMRALTQQVDHRFIEMEYRLMVRLGGSLTAVVVTCTTVLAFLLKH